MWNGWAYLCGRTDHLSVDPGRLRNTYPGQLALVIELIYAFSDSSCLTCGSVSVYHKFQEVWAKTKQIWKEWSE